MSLSHKFITSTLIQDRAAGGTDKRKLKIKSGAVVTVSLVVTNSKSPFRVIMRFKSGLTIQREVGKFDSISSSDAVAAAWKEIRHRKVVEQEGWSWVHPEEKQGDK